MIRIRSAVLSLAWVLFVTTLALPCRNVRAQADIHQTIATSQPKLVKIMVAVAIEDWKATKAASSFPKTVTSLRLGATYWIAQQP